LSPQLFWAWPATGGIEQDVKHIPQEALVTKRKASNVITRLALLLTPLTVTQCLSLFTASGMKMQTDQNHDNLLPESWQPFPGLWHHWEADAHGSRYHQLVTKKTAFENQQTLSLLGPFDKVILDWQSNSWQDLAS